MKRPFSEQLSEFPGYSRSNSRNGTHDLIYVKTLFSEQLSERLSELVGRQNFSPNSRSVFFQDWVGIPIAWYKARIPGFPRKSIRERASSVFGLGPERPQNISCARATSRLHRCTCGVALEQETFSRLQALHPQRPLAPSPIDLGEVQEFRHCTRVSGSQGNSMIFVVLKGSFP